MFRQSTRLVRIVRPRPLVTYGRATAPLMRRTYAEYHFPDDKAEGLEQSQIWKISQAIQQDHQDLQHCYQRIVNSKDPAEQLRYQNQFIWELARHAIAEELVVYPALEGAANNGAERASRDRAQHQAIKEQLYDFQKLRPGDAQFMSTLESLYKDLEHHIKAEEEQDLVDLEGTLSLTQSKELSKSFERTKMFTPTRSHPNAPNKPPFETVAGLMAAPIDKLRDMFTRFPKATR